MSSEMWVNAGSMFAIARESCARACAATDAARSHVDHDPLVAIVFAAAAAEALMNEIGELADRPLIDPSRLEPPAVRNLVSLLADAETSRETTTLKFLLAKLALTGQSYERGSNPYQDLALLMELRNSLVHLKSEVTELDESGNQRSGCPRVVSRLEAKHVLVLLEENAKATWVFCVSTPAAAKWACNAAAGIANDLFDSIPASQLKSMVEFFYRKHGAFDPIE